MVILVKIISMETVDIRNALHQYIDEGDDRLVKMVYELIKEYRQEGYHITEEEVNKVEETRERQLEYKRRRLIMEEREQHLKGEGITEYYKENEYKFTEEEIKQFNP
jgi:hypothetical protein